MEAAFASRTITMTEVLHIDPINDTSDVFNRGIRVTLTPIPQRIV